MKSISAFILSISLLFGCSGLVEAKPKSKPKAQAKKDTKKSSSKSSKNSKSSSRNSRSSSKSGRSSKNGKTSKNDRNSRQNKNSKSARSSKNSRDSRSPRSSRGSRSAVAPRNEAPAAPRQSVPKGTSTADRQVIVNVPVAPIRGQARLDAPYVANARLGTILSSSEKNPLWYKVQYTAGGSTQNGWIASTAVSEFTVADRAVVYQQIADRNSREDADFVSSAALVDFLGRAVGEVPREQALDMQFKRAVALRSALSRIGRDDRNVSPYADFLRDHESEIAYNAASGEYLVSSALLWNLADGYKQTPKGDEAAWYAARNPLPSDCGGMLNCYVFNLRMTDGEYLSQYPTGARANDASRNVSMMLGSMVADLRDQKLFKAPQDAESKAELQSLVAELRTIVLRTSAPERSSVLGSLDRIGELAK